MATITVKSLFRHVVDGFGLTHEHVGPAQPGEADDPFHDPLLLTIGIVFVLLALVILAATGLMHWGVEYHSPPWNSYSYPPPIAH